MPLSLILIVGALFAFVGLSLGVAVKMRSYGIDKNSLLALSPVVVFVVFVILPIAGVFILSARPDILKGTSDEFHNEVKKMNLFRRLVLSVNLTFSLVKMAPFVIGIISYFLASFIKRRRVTKEEREFIWGHIREAFTATVA